MYIDNRKILIVIGVITLVLFPVVTFTTGPLRIVLGLLFVLAFPGYTLLSALFPRIGDLGSIERVALSFGLSVTVVPLIGLILHYTQWGIRIYPILTSITLFIIVTLAIAYYRECKLPEAERLYLTLGIHLPDWKKMSKLDRSLSAFLVIAVFTIVGCISAMGATSTQGEKFTEFYILESGGKAEGYPQHVILGGNIDIIIGVVNHEYQSTSYQVVITIDRVEYYRVDIGTLAHREKREKRVSFTPRLAGEKQKIEFHLYKNGEDRSYFKDPLLLHIDVILP